MDSYQPIYDAVRSRLSNCDIGIAVETAFRDAGLCYYIERASVAIADCAAMAAEAHAAPSAVYRPSLTVDGNQWCALYGANLQDGIAGFGDTPSAAMRDFDKAWTNCKAGFVAELRPESGSLLHKPETGTGRPT